MRLVDAMIYFCADATLTPPLYHSKLVGVPPVTAAVHVNVKLSLTLTLPVVGQPEMVGA